MTKLYRTTYFLILLMLGISSVGLGALTLVRQQAEVATQTGTSGAGQLKAQVIVHPEKPGREIPSDFLGFSYEAPVLAKDNFDVRNTELIHLLANLGTGVLRYGGNSVEYTDWSRQSKTRPAGTRAVLTPQDLDRLFAFSKKTHWPVILGLNLGSNNPGMAADEATYAIKRGKRQLLALEIGNEPDLFMDNGLRPFTWGYREFRHEFEAYLHAIRARTPNAPIAGPVTCCTAGLKWLPRFLDDEGSQLVLATHHNYPFSASKGRPPSSPRYPTIPRLLSAESMEQVAEEMRQLVSEAAAHNLHVRIAEANSASSGGKDGVSNVFAAALWGADYAFTLAEQGVAGVNFHGGFHCGGYTPVCISDHHYTPQPLYYGMLLFHAAARGRLVPVEIHTQANVTAYATLADDGGLSVLLINKDDQHRVSADISGAGSYAHGRELLLTAPALDARSGITFGGSEVDPGGRWAPGSSEQIVSEDGVFHLQVPAATAVLIKFEK